MPVDATRRSASPGEGLRRRRGISPASPGMSGGGVPLNLDSVVRDRFLDHISFQLLLTNLAPTVRGTLRALRAEAWRRGAPAAFGKQLRRLIY